jgi:predicted small lipoprotein YifL
LIIMQARRATFTAQPLLRRLAGLTLISMLAACGYKGPLYMPPPPTDEALATPPAPAAVPAPEAATPAAIQAK